MEQVNQRKIEIIDNVYVLKLLQSIDSVNREGPSTSEREEEDKESTKVKGALIKLREERNYHIQTRVPDRWHISYGTS
jgi:hypothetical protein